MKLPALILSVMASGAPALAADGAMDHANPPQQLTVEHAQIVRPVGSGEAQAYLTIWNGSQTTVALASARSADFGRITIFQTDLVSGESTEMRTGSVLSIPGHTELSMRPNGIGLRLSQAAPVPADPTKSRLTVVFEDGTEIGVEADVVQSPVLLTRHRHDAEADFEEG